MDVTTMEMVKEEALRGFKDAGMALAKEAADLTDLDHKDLDARVRDILMIRLRKNIAEARLKGETRCEVSRVPVTDRVGFLAADRAARVLVVIGLQPKLRIREPLPSDDGDRDAGGPPPTKDHVLSVDFSSFYRL